MVDTPYPVARDYRRTAVLVGNGGTVYSGFGFKILDVDDVAVYLKRSIDTEFALVSATVSKAAALDYDDFSIAFASAITAADQYFVIGATLVERTAGVLKGTKIDPDAMEREFSRITMMLNEARRDLARAVLADPSALSAPYISGDIADNQVLILSGGRIIGGELLNVASPTEGAAVIAALALKSDLTYVNAQLALKAAAANVYSKTETDALLAASWAFQPIGVPIPLSTHLAGVAEPPTNQAYRYIKLTAGLTGAGQYNNGVLGSESVSGTAPLVLATAVITLAGSPLNGQTVDLINTERRFLRAYDTAGTKMNDAFQGHRMNNLDGAFWLQKVGGTFGGTGYNAGTTNTTGDPVTDGTNGTPRVANETRGKFIGETYYMRIK